MVIQAIILIVISSYLRKRLQNTQDFLLWNKRLQYLLYVATFLLVIPFVLDKTMERWVTILSSLLLGGVLYMIYKINVFKAYRFILTAVLPFLITSFLLNSVRIISLNLFLSWHSFLNTANSFAMLWMLGVWLVTNRQQRELERSKKRIAEEQRRGNIIASMRDELEVQVKERTAELTRQKEELEVALAELQATQAQLIQSEKMASLGELTAGIAHEIQNPLNFVNNFSEVSRELIDEMNQALDSNDKEEAAFIAADIKANLEKIAHHGKRADAIVKGMLQHSRTSTGTKEPTDINALADEYLRLSYHGLRAKDKSFNAKFDMHFDERIDKIEVVPQDIGRVLVNLFNNAFYAVNEKKKQLNGTYEPVVSVSTKKVDNQVEILIQDNGSGIPAKVIDKIFQPFFTTKPTGQGTGLGLSLSYDIITKGHGGEIEVETAEGVGTTFKIYLPL